MSRALFFAVLACAAPSFAETGYFSGIDDLPLAPGLTETGVAFSFDGAGGRIIGASAAGGVAPAAVRSFYAETLPSLGWALSPGAGEPGESVYSRGRERLSLTIVATGDGAELSVRMYVRPSPGD